MYSFKDLDGIIIGINLPPVCFKPLITIYVVLWCYIACYYVKIECAHRGHKCYMLSKLWAGGGEMGCNFMGLNYHRPMLWTFQTSLQFFRPPQSWRTCHNGGGGNLWVAIMGKTRKVELGILLHYLSLFMLSLLFTKNSFSIGGKIRAHQFCLNMQLKGIKYSTGKTTDA